MTKRVAVYARVSTTRQAENDISIPDQFAQSVRHCQKKGWHVVREFINAGASARDDKRPQFQALKGNVVARVIADVTTDTLTRFVRESVATDVSLLCTDQYTAYRDLGAEFPHGSVDHAKGQYVVGAIHTNTIEGFRSLIKRGVVGTYHKVSRKYLPPYVAEF